MGEAYVEISALEECLRQAELIPDPKFFSQILAESVIIVGQDGKPARAKNAIVDAHKPGKSPKFTRVEMSDLDVVEHGPAVVATCKILYESAKFSVTLRFMRVWVKKDGRWQIIAGSVSTA